MGSHTECLGHITRDFYSVNQCLKQFFFTAEVISVTPESLEEDQIITKDQIEKVLNGKSPEAIVIRTLPNEKTKLSKNIRIPIHRIFQKKLLFLFGNAESNTC